MVIRTGPQHDLVRRYFPELEPVVRLHSLDVDALPEQEASEAIGLLLDLGARDYRVATSAQQVLRGADDSQAKRAVTDRLDHMERSQRPEPPPGVER
jgi:hypothetical protein